MQQPFVWLVLAWLFAVGGCIGSFMNVVIYRLPAGLSLLHPPSRCPACETPIRSTDNVPIFGWLWLRGRCRHCRAAISARYPAVELLVALLFVGLAWIEPLSGGRNLPLRLDHIAAHELWGIYAYHLFLLCSLICAAFNEFDRQRLAWRLALPALAIGLIAPLAWPYLRPTLETPASSRSWAALTDGVIGAGVGGLVGLALSWVALQRNRPAATTAVRVRRSPRRPRPASSQLGTPLQLDLPITYAWAGAFLGWQAAFAIAAASVSTAMIQRLLSRVLPALRRHMLLSHLAAWTFVWIILWRPIQAMLY